MIAQATDCLGLREPPRVVARGMGWALPVRVIVWNSLYTSRNYYKPAGTIYRLAGAILSIGPHAGAGPEYSNLARTYDLTGRIYNTS